MSLGGHCQDYKHRGNWHLHESNIAQDSQLDQQMPDNATSTTSVVKFSGVATLSDSSRQSEQAVEPE
jgi:hypothetical protein